LRASAQKDAPRVEAPDVAPVSAGWVYANHPTITTITSNDSIRGTGNPIGRDAGITWTTAQGTTTNAVYTSAANILASAKGA
jgi:hypothetical protein